MFSNRLKVVTNMSKMEIRDSVKGTQTKWEKFSVYATIFVLAALVLGLLKFADNSIERILFCTGIFLMVMYLLTLKTYFIACLFIGGMVFTVGYTGKVFVPFLCYNNSNHDILAANSVWSESQNEFSDPYSADALMYTIFFKKQCMISSNGYYRDYAQAIFENVVTKDSIPQMVNHEDYMENRKFHNIGISLARNHVLLFTDTDTNALFNNAAYIFVNPVNLEECAEAILVNDDLGNIYIMAGSEWIDE